MPRRRNRSNIEKYHAKRRAGLIKPRLPNSSFRTDNVCGEIFNSKASCQINARSNSEETPECLDIMDNCRACQNKTQKESQIFIFATVKLPDIYQETTSLDIHENDGLPKILCRTCYDRLLEAYNFRKMCSASVLHFQQMLSMDVPEEKYTPPELMDALDIKTEPDDWDAPKSALSDLNCSSVSEDSLSDISDMQDIDEKFPKILITGKSQKSKRKEKLSLGALGYLNKMISKCPEESSNKKRKIVGRPCNLICGICNSRFYLKSCLEMHIRERHLELKPMDQMHGERIQFPCTESQYDTELGLLPELPKNEVLLCDACELEFKTVPALMAHRCIYKSSQQYFSMEPPRISSEHTDLIRLLIDQESHFCAICRIEKPTADELTIHMNSHLKEITEKPESTTEANRKHFLKSGKRFIRSTDSEDHSEAHLNLSSDSSSNTSDREFVPIRL